MLEHYFIRPTTVDRIRAAWLGEPIEQYVSWLHENGYAARNVGVRVPLLVKFGEFARDHGATSFDQLPNFVDAFVADWVHHHSQWCRSEADRRSVLNTARGPVEQLLQRLLPDYPERKHPSLPEPFTERALGFFDYLRQERGLKETTIGRYRHVLRRFEHYLERIGLPDLHELSAPLLSAFIAESHEQLGPRTLVDFASVLRVFLGFLYRERIITTDLGGVVEAPQHHRLADVPRSISWAQVQQVLEALDRRSPVGKRDYALILLMVTYGLRAREIAGLTLESIDWKRERLLIVDRKAGHTSAYPLSSVVGEAIIDYLQFARPEKSSRALFLQVTAPYRPLNGWSVSQQTARHLHKAGIRIPRAGSHTLRHTCAQRLVDAELPLKTIGDYLGHRSPEATAVYTKIQIEALREVALGDGETVL
jgi:site-specific recombinase XerD